MTTTKAELDDFLSQPVLAVVGVSRNKGKFGYQVYKDLKAKGYQVLPINPNAQQVEGDPCYPDLKNLPQTPGGIILVVPPAQSEKMVREAQEAGINRVWLQPGAESKAAIEFCKSSGMSVIVGECIMMFAGSGGFPHNIHRWINKVTGKLPK